jgi:hypothetical protein
MNELLQGSTFEDFMPLSSKQTVYVKLIGRVKLLSTLSDRYWEGLQHAISVSDQKQVQEYQKLYSEIAGRLIELSDTVAMLRAEEVL